MKNSGHSLANKRPSAIGQQLVIVIIAVVITVIIRGDEKGREVS